MMRLPHTRSVRLPAHRRPVRLAALPQERLVDEMPAHPAASHGRGHAQSEVRPRGEAGEVPEEQLLTRPTIEIQAVGEVRDRLEPPRFSPRSAGVFAAGGSGCASLPMLLLIKSERPETKPGVRGNKAIDGREEPCAIQTTVRSTTLGRVAPFGFRCSRVANQRQTRKYRTTNPASGVCVRRRRSS